MTNNFFKLRENIFELKPEDKNKKISLKKIPTLKNTNKKKLTDCASISLTENERVAYHITQYIAGQKEPIRSLISIIACRDRRNKLPEGDLKNSIKPSHAIFHGPTGCGKSYLLNILSEYKEIPFVKTEATQYTEVGYVGRDVEMMVRDLIERSIQIVRAKHLEVIKDQITNDVYRQIINILLGPDISEETYEVFNKKLINGELDDKEIEIEVNDEGQGFATIDMPGGVGQVGMMNFSDMIGKILGKKNLKKIKSTVKEAIELLTEEESEKALNEGQIIKEAIILAQTEGIIFIDEIDKIITTHNTGSRGEVSKEGVQRDLLPLLDGTTLKTKYGEIKTDHILFIAAGAFHMSKFSDLLPELQGRFPMHIKLHTLTEGHFIDILTHKKNSLITQHQAMLAIDNVKLIFTDSAVKKIAQVAAQMNQEIENTGARRLRTIMDKILADINFESEKYFDKEFEISEEYIQDKMKDMLIEIDLQKFIL